MPLGRDPRRMAEQVRRMLHEEDELIDPEAERGPEPPQPGEISEEAVREGLGRIANDER
jgi:hypothetical protein